MKASKFFARVFKSEDSLARFVNLNKIKRGEIASIIAAKNTNQNNSKHCLYFYYEGAITYDLFANLKWEVTKKLENIKSSMDSDMRELLFPTSVEAYPKFESDHEWKSHGWHQDWYKYLEVLRAIVADTNRDENN